MIQIPANINDATTGHKIAGNVKRCNCCIMANWRTCYNVQKLGICCPVRCAQTIRIYLVAPIDMDKSFKPSSELKKYIENARQKETDILEKRKRAIAQLNWL
jgi:hypothetical protein